MEGGPNFCSTIKNEIMEQVNWCLIQKTLLCPVSHSVSLPSPPGCYGNLGNITLNMMGCVSSRQRGDRRVVVPSPPQVKSVFTKDSPVWFKSICKRFDVNSVGYTGGRLLITQCPRCNHKCSSPND